MDWQVLVGASRLVKHQAVAQAYHWLQPKVLLLDLFCVVDIGADHLLEAQLPVVLQNDQQLVVDVGTHGLEEARAGAEFVEVEEVLLHPNHAVVWLGRHFLEPLQLHR